MGIDLMAEEFVYEAGDNLGSLLDLLETYKVLQRHTKLMPPFLPMQLNHYTSL